MKTDLSITKDILRDMKEMKELLSDFKKGEKEVKTGLDI